MNFTDKLLPAETNNYIDSLINEIFSVLPIYEEKGISSELLNKIRNMEYKIEGFFLMMKYDTSICMNILSLCYSLETANSHTKIRSVVLTLCTLLSSLKDGECNGS